MSVAQVRAHVTDRAAVRQEQRVGHPGLDRPDAVGPQIEVDAQEVSSAAGCSRRRCTRRPRHPRTRRGSDASNVADVMRRMTRRTPPATTAHPPRPLRRAARPRWPRAPGRSPPTADPSERRTGAWRCRRAWRGRSRAAPRVRARAPARRGCRRTMTPRGGRVIEVDVRQHDVRDVAQRQALTDESGLRAWAGRPWARDRRAPPPRGRTARRSRSRARGRENADRRRSHQQRA